MSTLESIFEFQKEEKQIETPTEETREEELKESGNVTTLSL